MSRVGVRREHEGVVLRTTVVPRLAKPARHPPYAPDGELFSFGGRKKGPGCPRFTPAQPLFALTVAPRKREACPLCGGPARRARPLARTAPAALASPAAACRSRVVLPFHA